MSRIFFRIVLAAFALIMSGPLLRSQNTVTISGTVFEGGSGEPLIGASVLVKDTNNGAVTDLDGRFSISVPQGAELVVGSIGFKDYSFIAAKDVKDLRIILKRW